ncbi:M14 family zinc carboxypeptidase [Virgibacillus sp. CBA3643]|uniref:M14 family zinc carboxypeptidase n=1 Tax=Virgibacillus sp. CBA3643 TaxID=2942278 RepID=UPI0035A3783A
MLNTIGFYGNPYTKYATYQEFADSLSETGAEIEDLGVGEDGEKHLYGLKHGDTENKPVFFIDADCHGSEWQSSHFSKEFMRRIVNREYHNKPLMDAIVNTFAFYCVVSTNPWGYENNDYLNFNGVNLNRNTDQRWEQATVGEGTINYKGTEPFSELESQIVRDKTYELKPFFAVNVHTTNGEKGGIDTGKVFRDYRSLLLDVYHSCNLSVAKELGGTQEWSVGYSPTFTGFYGNQISKEGTPTIPTILEAQADQTDFDYGLSSLFVLAIYMYYFYKTGVHQIVDIEDVMKIVESDNSHSEQKTK